MCNACHRPLLNSSIYVFVNDSRYSIDQDGSTSTLLFPVNVFRGSQHHAITQGCQGKALDDKQNEISHVLVGHRVPPHGPRVRVEDILERGAWPIQ